MENNSNYLIVEENNFYNLTYKAVILLTRFMWKTIEWNEDNSAHICENIDITIRMEDKILRRERGQDVFHFPMSFWFFKNKLKIYIKIKKKL